MFASLVCAFATVVNFAECGEAHAPDARAAGQARAAGDGDGCIAAVASRAEHVSESVPEARAVGPHVRHDHTCAFRVYDRTIVALRARGYNMQQQQQWQHALTAGGKKEIIESFHVRDNLHLLHVVRYIFKQVTIWTTQRSERSIKSSTHLAVARRGTLRERTKPPKRTSR